MGKTELDNLIDYLKENSILIPHTGAGIFSCEELLEEINLLRGPDKREKVVDIMPFEEACKQSLLGKGCLYNKYGDVIYGNHITGKIQCKPAKNSDIVFLSSMWSFDKDIISEGEESRDDF